MKFALWGSGWSRKLKLLTNKRQRTLGFCPQEDLAGSCLVSVINIRLLYQVCIRFLQGETKPAVLLFWYCFSLIKLPLKVEGWGSFSWSSEETSSENVVEAGLTYPHSLCSMRRPKGRVTPAHLEQKRCGTESQQALAAQASRLRLCQRGPLWSKIEGKGHVWVNTNWDGWSTRAQALALPVKPSHYRNIFNS